jgi:hypothetical protein
VSSYCYASALARGTKKAGPKSPAEALAAARGEYDGKDGGEATREPHAPLAFDRLSPPFDPRFDAGELRLEETEFHTLAYGVFGPILARVEEERA